MGAHYARNYSRNMVEPLNVYALGDAAEPQIPSSYMVHCGTVLVSVLVYFGAGVGE
jgi:hypothetical protein